MHKILRRVLLLTIAVWCVVVLLLAVRAATAADLAIITDVQGNTGVLYDLGLVTLYGDARGNTGQVKHGPMLDLWQFRSREGVVRQGMALPISPVEGVTSLPTSRHPLTFAPLFAFPPDPCPDCDDTERP